MRALVRWLTRNPVAVGLVLAALAFGGIYAVWTMPVDLFPNLSVPVVNVISHYPGAGPADIELLISRPVEDALRSIPSVKRVASTSAQGLSQVTAEFTWNTTVQDARQLVQAELGRVQGRLPAGVSPQLESIGMTLQEVCGYVVYGPVDPVSLRTVVRYDVASRLMNVSGVSSVEVLGGDRPAFYVRIKTGVLARLHCSAADVAQALRNSNGVSVGGYLDRSGREFLLRGDGRLQTLDDLRAVPIKAGAGKTVLLGDVAEIYAGHAPRHYTVTGDGEPAVAMIIRKQPGASTTQVVAGVDAALAGLTDLFPGGTRVKKYYDQSEIISEARDEMLHDLLIGALLVVVVLFFFLGSWRPTLIVASTIPLTVLATLAVMGSVGLGLNVITMVALALAIGMIVDDAIVVAENIHRHAATDPAEAGVAGAAEIAGPDASGTLTTVAAFLPLVVVGGIAGLFLRPFGFTVSVALLVSLLLSLSYVPVLYSRGNPGAVRDSAGTRLLTLLNGILQRVLGFAFDHKSVAAAAALTFLALAGLSAWLGAPSLLPPIDEGALLIEYVTPPGTSLAESDRVGATLEHIALADPAVSCVYRRTGSPEVGYQVEGVNRGELAIKLRPKTVRARSGVQVMADLKAQYAKIPGVVFLYHQPTQEKIDESFSGLPALFGVTIYGSDESKLIALAGQVEAIMAKDPAVASVINNTKVRTDEVTVRLDYPRLAANDVAPQTVLDTLQAARIGLEATRLVRERQEVAVLVTLDAGQPLDLNTLARLPVATRNGTTVPLARVAQVQQETTPAEVSRLNGAREVTLLAEVDGSIPSAIRRLRAQFRSLQLPEGYAIDFTGQYQVLYQTLLEVGFTLLAAALLVYLIMVMQFRSWRQPLAILVSVPFSLVGALVALFLTRQSLDVSVAMGAVTLVGIAVNNAIVLVDYANRCAAAGTAWRDALSEAVSVRLRPILLTSLTTIAALLPTALGAAADSRMFQSFAIAVIGGLVSAVIATLVLIPTLLSPLSSPPTFANPGNGGYSEGG